ncbi:uncharacterized protein C8R40DRAFT_1073890 [Lentinula edodes]|uniref:uncharacterized protein n=1 Tax=Lentinula edodes TaxID=5353 RepID=UPI001E8CDB28|nr:uncharacterized protein C8R40DRAFT_1073890 [Lentinula edodes]KAH7869554.1 hypothetical protein C8R40DRAFT_1073890 [Lentinula edodes]
MLGDLLKAFTHMVFPNPTHTRDDAMLHQEGRNEGSQLYNPHDQGQPAHSSSDPVRPKYGHGIPQEHRDAQPDANAAVTVPSTTAIREHDGDRMNTQSASTDSRTETFQSNRRTYSDAVQSAPSTKAGEDRKTDTQAGMVPGTVNHRNAAPSQSSGRGPSGSIEIGHRTTRDTSLHGRDGRADRETSSGVLRESRIPRQYLEEQIAHIQKQNQRLEAHLCDIQRRNQEMEAQLGNAQHSLMKQKNEIGELRKHLMNEQAAAAHYKTKDAHSQELLDARMKELQGARAFLNTSDMYSGADIVSMVKSLNGEIFQAAASITDTIVGFMSSQVSLENDPWAVDIVSKTLGEEVATLLQHNHAVLDEHMTLVQIALQAGLNQRSQYVLCLWAMPGEANDAINGAFAGIQMQQSWYSIDCLHEHIAEIVKAILIVAGWWPSRSSEIVARIESTIRGRISAIVLLLEKLDIAMTQITSMDLTLEMPTPGVHFDTRRMQDEDGKRSLTDETVLCTSEIGLMMKSVDIDGRSEEAILLKPKVVFRSAFKR